MLDSIAAATTSALQTQLQQQFPDILFKTVIPAFERSCQNMLLQLSNTYSKGIDQGILFHFWHILSAVFKIKLQRKFESLMMFSLHIFLFQVFLKPYHPIYFRSMQQARKTVAV